ncbi:MAG: T9SS type A sorting domain-containing protein, partial [Bacteroidales bacterium]|nr:T9SS type A sorting domain-containing protein [Candidatus Latescibacterota bacterium]
LVVYDKPSFSTCYILKGLVNAYLTYREHSGTDREQAQLLGMIDEIVASYKRNQEVTGRFYILSSLMERYPVQQQLKADIALMLAHRITGDPSIPAAVKRNIDWVMTDRRDRSGKCMSGIVWASDDTTSFFECHQMWFMTVTAYLEEATGFDYSMCRAEAFTFLTDDNYAGIDLYDHNATQYGAFFAYRMISSDGTIQNETENCFKGAYEIGASLWAMALNYDLSVEGYTRLITQPPAGESDGWDKAIFTEHDFGPGNMVFQWDVQFMDVSSDGAFTGLFNDQNGDWRVMFSTGSGLQYRNTLDQERGLFDSSRLQSGMTYTVRVTKSNMNCVIFAVLENGIEVMREQMDDIMPFDACYFGVLQCNAEGAEAGNILVDNIMFQQSADPPCVNLLSQNVPNPFNAHTTISFDIGMAGQVTLDIYDPVGRFITRLVDATLARNNYTANWDGTNWRGRAVSSGVYFYVLKGEKHSEKKKMILLR